MSYLNDGAKALFLGAYNAQADGALKVVLVDLGAYVPSRVHRFLSDIPVGARVGTPTAVGVRTVDTPAFGVLRITTDTVIPNVPALAPNHRCDAVQLFHDSGVAGTSDLIAFIDDDVTVVPNNGDVTVIWPTAGVFAIAP